MVLDLGFAGIKDVAEIPEQPEVKDGKGASAAGAGGEAGEGKVETTAIRLNSNAIESVEMLVPVLSPVLLDLGKLHWIDLSFNNISTIGTAFSKLPHLKRLYLHSNKISKLSEVDNLQSHRTLEALTFHGCPVQDRKNYRVYDFSAVTKRELDAAVSWRRMTKIVRKPKGEDEDD